VGGRFIAAAITRAARRCRRTRPVARWISEHGTEHGLDSGRIAVAGDSVGGNMAADLTLLAKQRGGVTFRRQVLFYPVTDANFDTEFYHLFATGYFLRRDAMQRLLRPPTRCPPPPGFWDQYTTDPAQRAEITASPLLRDEGEAYAAKLTEAGVEVTAIRYPGIVHDFVMVTDIDTLTSALH
jgi:acetyl esterase